MNSPTHSMWVSYTYDKTILRFNLKFFIVCVKPKHLQQNNIKKKTEVKDMEFLSYTPKSGGYDKTKLKVWLFCGYTTKCILIISATVRDRQYLTTEMKRATLKT